jgi:hypothetical protein
MVFISLVREIPGFAKMSQGRRWLSAKPIFNGGSFARRRNVSLRSGLAVLREVEATGALVSIRSPSI